MRRLVWAIAATAACGRPLFPLFPRDEVYVAPAAPQPPAQSPPRCTIKTPIASLGSYYGTLPPGTGEIDAYNAALQFLVTSGNTIAAQDPGAHTIITNRFDGETWVSTCPINHYFMYALHIAVVGSQMIVDMECWTSTGWEAGYINGYPTERNRGELTPCSAPKYVSERDAKIPSLIFEGSMLMLSARNGAPTP